jgi:hypothetical protein
MWHYLVALGFFVVPIDGARFMSEGRGASAHGGHLVGGGKGKIKATQAEKIANSLGEVIEVLAQMLKEFGEQEIEDKDNWEKYSKWSGDTESEKNTFIQDQTALIMSETAKMNANKLQVSALTTQLAKLAADILDTKQSIAELIKMRKEERTQFEAAMTDLTKTIQAVTKATGILEGHYASASAASLQEIRTRVQLALAAYGMQSNLSTKENMKKLNALLQVHAHGPDFLNTDGSKYGSYEKQGGAGGVIGMLENLRSQLETQQQDLVAKENEAQRQYEETKTAKEADLAHMEKTETEKKAKKVTCEATIETCIATIDQSGKDIVDAKAYLVQLLADRETFTKAFGNRKSLRASEQAATQAALDALQAVSAGAKDAVSLIQQRTLRKVQVSTSAVKKLGHQLEKLVGLGKQLKSQALVQMATKLKGDYFSTQQQSHYDAGAFGPVLKLLGDLITRLETEAASETSHHEWCETEKSQSETSKTERERILHTLKASIDSLTTEIAQLKTEILTLESEIARVKEETRIAKQIRAAEKAAYEQAKKDHEEVLAAIAEALRVLGGQYGFLQVQAKTKTMNTAKHQQKRQEPGASPFSEYASGAGGGGSAMTMLEDLSGRYTQALNELITDEATAVNLHEALLKRNAQFIVDATADRDSKVSERRAKLNGLAQAKEDMKSNLMELHQVAKYLMDLRPSCDDIRSTFEERKKRREAEIAALREALQVISDPSMMG